MLLHYICRGMCAEPPWHLGVGMLQSWLLLEEAGVLAVVRDKSEQGSLAVESAAEFLMEGHRAESEILIVIRAWELGIREADL